MKAVPITALLHDKPTDWALGQFNVHNIELALSAIRAGEAENAPLILAVGPSTVQFLEDISPLIAAIHKMIEKSKVPIALHLDHARSLELVRQALDLGFSSVMFDGSSLPFEENVRLTAEVAEMGHACGASVEGEIGIVPMEGALTDDAAENNTDPEKAALFAQETKIDLIAVSVGSVHGMQSQNSSIDCELIKELSTKLNRPQVLHGASGVRDEFYPEAIRGGIRKININTMLQVRFRNAVSKTLNDTPDIGMLSAWTTGMQAVYECVRERIRCFKASNKA